MAEEMVYTIPLREIVRSARQYRSRKAINILKKFLEKHLNTSEEMIRIGQSLNEAIWAKGMQKPPSKVKITVRKEGNIYRVELFGHEEEKEEKKKKPEKKEKKEKKKKKEKKSKKKKSKEKKKEKKPSMDWLKKDLKKYAEDKGIDVKSNDTKKDIIKKIKKKEK